MPALPAVPQVIKFELLWTQASIPCANILHAGYTGSAPEETDCASLAESVATAFWATGLYDGYSADTILVGCRATDLTSDTANVGEYSDGHAGTYDAPALPAQASILVNYSISRRYRGGHPRSYFPPPCNFYLEGPSQWSSDIVSALGTQVTALLEALATASSGGCTLTGAVNVSYVSSGSPRVDPITDPLTGFVVSPVMATQRRRIRASSY